MNPMQGEVLRRQGKVVVHPPCPLPHASYVGFFGNGGSCVGVFTELVAKPTIAAPSTPSISGTCTWSVFSVFSPAKHTADDICPSVFTGCLCNLFLGGFSAVPVPMPFGKCELTHTRRPVEAGVLGLV